MAQAYRSIYISDYRPKRSQSRKHTIHDRFTSMLPASGNWLIIQSLEEQNKSKTANLKEVEEKIKKMYRDRYWSVYQVDYGHSLLKDDEEKGDLPQLADQQYLEECRRRIKKKNIPVLPPRQTARNIFGYIRPDLAYTSTSVYQQVHDELACDLLARCKDIDKIH